MAKSIKIKKILEDLDEVQLAIRMAEFAVQEVPETKPIKKKVLRSAKKAKAKKRKPKKK